MAKKLSDSDNVNFSHINPREFCYLIDDEYPELVSQIAELLKPSIDSEFFQGFALYFKCSPDSRHVFKVAYLDAKGLNFKHRFDLSKVGLNVDLEKATRFKSIRRALVAYVAVLVLVEGDTLMSKDSGIIAIVGGESVSRFPLGWNVSDARCFVKPLIKKYFSTNWSNGFQKATNLVN